MSNYEKDLKKELKAQLKNIMQDLVQKMEEENPTTPYVKGFYGGEIRGLQKAIELVSQD